MIFITENVPTSLRGEITNWMLQLKPGVFIGTLNALVGEKLWKKIQEKQGEGGAIWVKATNNEQRFKLSISGKTHWTIRDFDGLQLITHPHKKPIKSDVRKQKKVKIPRNHNIKKIDKKNKDSQKIPKVVWNTENTPINFITRKVLFKNKDSKIKSIFSGTSAYGEYPPEKLWEKPWIDDIKNMAKSLISYLINIKNLSELSFYNKKLMCLDIETTDFLPKAYEGFVNIIGISILDLREIKDNNFCLQLFQTFNMTRKKANVPLLLNLVEPYFKDIDTLLVFNKNFDITILQSVINEFSLNIALPLNIEDLQDFFPNLKALERFLSKKVGIERSTTNKDKYSEYYSLFKGKGKIGYDKQIEPIGTYNLTDALTPLFAYLLIKSQV